MPPENYLKFIEQVTTPARFRHSLGVMQVMGELAEVYGLDKELAETIGILHDAAKDLPPERQQQLIRDGEIEIRYSCETDYLFFLHGPVGAVFVQQELGITDKLILDAITNHTYCGNGDNFDHPLCWCLRIADLIEPGRNWSQWGWFQAGMENLRSIVYSGRLEEGAFLLTSSLLKWFTEQSLPIHPRMQRANQELAARLKLDAGFLQRQIARESRVK